MKNIVAAVLAVSLAVSIGFLFIKNNEREETITPVINTNGTLKAFQIGAYSTKEAAEDIVSNVGGKVIEGEKLFYVYYTVLSGSHNIEKMINYLDKNNIYYYVKNVSASEKFRGELLKYEELMEATKSDIAFQELNKQLINLYEVG